MRKIFNLKMGQRFVQAPFMENSTLKDQSRKSKLKPKPMGKAKIKETDHTKSW